MFQLVQLISKLRHHIIANKLNQTINFNINLVYYI
jgi:hypothetical protein